MPPRILAFAGSLRRESFNKKLIHTAIAGAREAGAEVTHIDLRDFPMPIYDGDLEQEQGIPENGKKLQAIFKEHQGLMLACPEYNSSITGVLKNTIDWVSRPVPNEPALFAFTGKAAVLMSASTGALGGLRGLVHVRSILGNIGVIVLPEQVAVPKAADALAADGTLKDEKQRASVTRLGRLLTEMVAKLHR